MIKVAPRPWAHPERPEYVRNFGSVKGPELVSGILETRHVGWNRRRMIEIIEKHL